MTTEYIISLGQDTMITALMVVGPIMAVAFVVGLGISLLQAIMQLQEATIAFVPKLLAIGVAILLFGHWMLNVLLIYTHKMLSGFTKIIGI